jgi:N-acyl-D-amino-acid deacylase
MDPETNHDAIANVGIKDGKIAAITNNTIAGNETIEATGLIVVPGFIDHQQPFHGRSHDQTSALDE